MISTKARSARHHSRTALVLVGDSAFAAPVAAQDAPADRRRSGG